MFEWIQRFCMCWLDLTIGRGLKSLNLAGLLRFSKIFKMAENNGAAKYVLENRLRMHFPETDQSIAHGQQGSQSASQILEQDMKTQLGS